MGDFWVFGYGSLMWRPGFAHVQTERARLHGFRRSLCVRSFDHRGNEKRPGLVLGLDRGGSCVGMSFRVPFELRDEVLAYLRERELVSSVYQERLLPVRLDTGGTVLAIAYVVDPMHRHYAGALTQMDAASIVAEAQGASGSNRDYLANSIDHLKALGIRDRWLEGVAAIIPQHRDGIESLYCIGPKTGIGFR